VVYSAYLDQARYLTDIEWRRLSSFESRAMQVLATSAVSLAIVSALAAQGNGMTAAKWVVVVAGGLLVIAAGLSVAVIWPRTVNEGGLNKFRDSYLEYRDSETDQAYRVREQLAGMLIGGPSGDDLLKQLQDDTQKRACWLRYAAAALVTALAVLVAGSALTIAGG